LAGILGVCSVHLEYPCDRMRGWKMAAAPGETAPVFPLRLISSRGSSDKVVFSDETHKIFK
jgi:hypothetical protein